MELDAKHKEAALAYINDKWPAPQECPVCRSTEWQLMDEVYQILQYRPLTEPMAIIPTIITLCENCAYMMVFNAMWIGIVEEDAEAEDEDE